MGTSLFDTKKLFRWLTWSPLLTFSIVFVLFFILSYLRLDPDFGWHVASGDYFFHHGIPATDIFTYTAPHFPWVDHEWLSDVIVYLVDLLGGYTLLAGLYASMWTLAFFLVGRRVHGPLVILGVLAVLPFAGVRAVTWTVIGAVLVSIIVSARNHRWRLILPLLFLVWANVHGGFAIGVVLVGYWALAKRSKQLALILAVSIATTFVTPYGIGIYVEIFRTMTDGSLRWTISEWLPIGYVWQTIGYVAIWSAGFLLLRGKNWRSYLQIDVLLFLAAMSSIRHFPLFVVLSMPFTRQYTKNLLKNIPDQITRPQRNVLCLITVVIIALAGWGGYDMYAVPLDKEARYPVGAVQYLRIHPCTGNLFNDYGAGGYLLWKLPRQKVYIDGRMPSWEGEGHKYMDDYFRVFDDKSFRNEQFKLHNITCVLIRKGGNGVLIDDLARDKWKVVVEANGYVLLEK